MVHQTASRNGGGSTASTPPSSARHAGAASPFAPDAASDAPSAAAAAAANNINIKDVDAPSNNVDRTPPRNPPPSSRRPWRVPPQLASVAPAAASFYRQLVVSASSIGGAGAGTGAGGGRGNDGGGLASWVGLGSSSSTSASPSRRGSKRAGGQVFKAVGNSRVAHAVRANKRIAVAGLAVLAVVVLVSSVGGGRGSTFSYSRSLVADRDNSSELDAATIADLAALSARQGGGGGVGVLSNKAASSGSGSSGGKKSSPTAADLPGTAAASSSAATATELAIQALDRSELSDLVQSTGFFSPDEAEAVVDAVAKGDLDTAELLRAIEEEKAKQAAAEQRARDAVQAAEDASRAPATKSKGGRITADDVDEWFFDDLDDEDDDFFFADEDEEEEEMGMGRGGGGRGRGGRAGGGGGGGMRRRRTDDGFGDYFDDDADADEFGFAADDGEEEEQVSTMARSRKGGAGRRQGGAARGSSSSNRRSSSKRRASATVSATRRGGGAAATNVFDDDFEDEEAFSSRGGVRGRNSRASRNSRSSLVDFKDDEMVDEDARSFGDVDDGDFDDEFGDELAAGAGQARRKSGRFAKDDEEPVRRGGAGGGRKASPAAKKPSSSSSSRGGRDSNNKNAVAPRGPAAAADDDFADEDAAPFGGDGDDDDLADPLFVDEDELDGGGPLDDDDDVGGGEPPFDDEEVGGAAGAKRSKGFAAAAAAGSSSRKKPTTPGGQKQTHPEPDFRSGGAKASLAGAARAKGSSSESLTHAAAVGDGRKRSNNAALPSSTTTLDSRRSPAGGNEDLDATAAANPLPRNKITASDLITRNDDDDDGGGERLSRGDRRGAAAAAGFGNGIKSGGVASVAAAHENFRSKVATANSATVNSASAAANSASAAASSAAQDARMQHTAAAVASGLAAFEASSDANAIATAVGGAAAGSKTSSSSSSSSKTASTTATPPVVVGLANRFFFGERYARVVPGCTWRGGASLPCEFTADQARLAEADAIALHIPGMAEAVLDAAVSHRRPEQALVGVAMESPANYPLLANDKFLARFDLLATLVPPEAEGGAAEGASSSSPKRVWYPYYDDMFRRCWEAEGNPAATATATTKASSSSSTKLPASLHPSHLRENALAYVNSNCGTKSGRDELVKMMVEVLEPQGIPLRSYGSCLNNMPRSARADTKIDTLRRYKFCVAVENSESPHYVSEKVYDAFVAGCVPVYFGAPNVLDYVPYPDAIIDVRALGGARKAAEEIARLVADDAAYAEKHAWRETPEKWSPGFKKLQAQSWRDGAGPFDKCSLTWTVDSYEISDPHMRRQCAICREVAEFQDRQLVGGGAGGRR